MDLRVRGRSNTGINIYMNETYTNLGRSKNHDLRQRIREIIACNDHVIKPKQVVAGKDTQMKQSTCTMTPISDDGCKKYNPEHCKIMNNFCEYNKNVILADKNLIKKLSHSGHNVIDKNFDYTCETCSKNMPKTPLEPTVTYAKSGEIIKLHHKENQDISNETTCAEKMTYCRPVINMYNQEFIYKCIEKNTRLQKLVKKLIVAREREKQNEVWNNYINELKNKHKYYQPEPNKIPTNFIPNDESPDIIDDYYNTRYKCKQSDPCEHLLNDFYTVSDEDYSEIHFYRPREQLPSTNRPYNYDNNTCCFPTASQGRLMMLNRERRRNNYADHWENRPAGRFCHRNTIFVDKDCGQQSTSKSFKKIHSNKLFEFSNKKKAHVIKSMSVQTELYNFSSHSKDLNTEYIKAKYHKVSKNVDKLREKLCGQSESDAKKFSLSNIENKLDVLIQSINAFIMEIKSKKSTSNNNRSTSVSFTGTDNNNINKTRSDTFGLLKREQIICGRVQEKTKSQLAFASPSKIQDTITEILDEEMHKSEIAKRDIEEFLSTPVRPCAVQITIDIPTKEGSTEVTDSFYKGNQTKDIIVEGIDNPGNSRRMAIAVNTDPLGLLALFRISTEAVKQFLSFMPNIGYYTYLSSPHVPETPKNGAVSRYLCNICGVSFDRPSKLSDHIQQHNLGDIRNCCVCRHVIDMKHHRPGLFACQYCGQMFTRAYCRELHEQACGKRIGRQPDITSSLMLLT